MDNQNSLELNELIKLLNSKTKLVAMLAPSFPIDFSYPEIIGKLKRLGFSHVVEVSKGAVETNNQLLELVKNNPTGRYITPPCPAIVRLVRNKYPHLVQYLAKIDSPMVNCAKIVKQKFPDSTPVFIGPCPPKKLEAKEDAPELGIIVLTYLELNNLFEQKGIKSDPNDQANTFDFIGTVTRLYPISGGLAQSACLKTILTDEEFDVISGTKLVTKSLEEFPTNRVKVLDILMCDGGCVNGAGIVNKLLPLEKRREKIISYWNMANQD